MSAKTRFTLRSGKVKITLDLATADRLNAILWTTANLGHSLVQVTDALDEMLGEPTEALKDEVES